MSRCRELCTYPNCSEWLDHEYSANDQCTFCSKILKRDFGDILTYIIGDKKFHNRGFNCRLHLTLCNECYYRYVPDEINSSECKCYNSDAGDYFMNLPKEKWFDHILYDKVSRFPEYKLMIDAIYIVPLKMGG